MGISAKIIADSINPYGSRLTTWILKYPRFIHSEFMTHRVFSRNAASSRAIPIKKMLDAVREDPAFPEVWGLNQKGMQALNSMDEELSSKARQGWLAARDSALDLARNLESLGCHKQIVNRLVEPWMYITVLATASEHDNVFALRAHKDAEPAFQVLAYNMVDRYLKSVPQKLSVGEWHIPFGDKMPDGASNELKLKISVARAARLSYLTFDGKMDVESDLRIFEQLKDAGHWSPFEHAAQAAYWDPNDEEFLGGNFDNTWIQYRKLFKEESSYVDLKKLLADKPSWIKLEDETVDK